MGFSTEFWKQELWRAMEFDSKDAFLQGFLEGHIKGSQLRVVSDVLGHLALFGIAPANMPQIDQHLGELLATEI